MSSIAIRLPVSFVETVKQYADINLRSVPKQIEYWAMLGRCAEDNPDLPLEFIKTCLLAKEEIRQGKIEPFTFRKK